MHTSPVSIVFIFVPFRRGNVDRNGDTGVSDEFYQGLLVKGRLLAERNAAASKIHLAIRERSGAIWGIP